MVTPEQLQEQEAKFKALKIQPSDIIEKFLVSGYKGKQTGGNTPDTVYLKHIPTGIEVKCNKSPDANLNYFLARQLLAYKIEEKLTGISGRMREFEKIRKRKAKSKRKANQKWQG